jgi:Domain of unknown function (DUF4440)
MKHKLLLVFIALLAAAPLCLAQSNATSKPKSTHAAGSQSDQMVINNSRSVWEAYKSRNIAAMKALTAEDYVAHTLEGPSNLKRDIDTIEKLTIESFTIDEPKVVWATKDMAILHYKCNLKGSFEGKHFKPIYATEVWANRGGKWQILSYAETPVS